MYHNENIYLVLQGYTIQEASLDLFSEDNYEYFESKTNGVISDSIVQNWTPSALDCYKLNCKCAQCPIAHRHYSFKCKMNEIVQILLETKGIPDEDSILNPIESNFKEDIVA